MEPIKPSTLIAKKSTNRSRDLEAELHKYFERKRLTQSEWFSLLPTQAEWHIPKHRSAEAARLLDRCNDSTKSVA